MDKALTVAVAALAAALISGCALVGRHSVPTESGRKTTVGLIAIDAMGDGYPMIPFYSSVEIGGK